LFSIRHTGIRSYSTSNNSSLDSLGKVIFFDADKDKLDILNYVKGKTGIYMWINKLNRKKYVGSSVDLRRRLLEYYNVNRLLNESSMPINVVLLKYGYHNFSLTILEICDVDNLMSREKHFFEEYTPEYNILDTPGNPSRGFGWRHSEAAIENMRIAAYNRNKSPEILAKLSTAQPNSIKVEVVDIETNISTRYNAIRAAARALGIDRRYIENYIYLNQDKPVLGKYTFKLINSSDKIKKKIQITSKKNKSY
jgi:GIY-YIG catalytic domain/NUMOD1 domain